MLQGEVLVGERLGAVDARRAGAVAVEEVAALAHEAGDLGGDISILVCSIFLAPPSLSLAELGWNSK